MDDEVQWATGVIDKKVELENKSERLKALTRKPGIMKMDTPGLEEEKFIKSLNRRVMDIKATEHVWKRSSDLHQEIVDLGGAENLTKLRKKRKSRKDEAAPSSRAVVEVVIGPVDPSDFLRAAVQGRVKVIERFLEDGGNPNTCDEFKRTALHRASLEGHTDIVHKLLDKGADINFKDRLDCRAVHWACRGGKLGTLKALQNRGADLNVKDRLMSTPLHVATRTGHYDVVEHLLSSGIKINAKDREGDTALHDAVRLNRYKIVKLLILRGADMKVKNAEGVTATEQVKQWQFDTKETLERLDGMKDVGMV
ncbi:hypothetical protein MATL_G00185160 [Megalops atlanticus]|uniref:Ankyrin repeat domain-containing protein 2 n=1 Tax=Megalops atlanticus TaxID=7932 RepID=A0A9D3PMH7_MEGAT|nr:hypothetical protein MATL_G00185160 [Megalops atlanticus]